VCNTVDYLLVSKKAGQGGSCFSYGRTENYIHSCNMQLYGISKAMNFFVTPVYHVTEYTICMHGSIHG